MFATIRDNPINLAEHIRASLTAKLLLALAAISIALSLVMGAVGFWQQNQAAIEAERSEAYAAVMTHIDALALAVQNGDDNAVGVIARDLVMGASIAHVEIIGIGERRFAADRPGERLGSDYVWDVPIRGVGSSQQIGTLRITENYAGILSQNVKRLATLFVLELAKVIAVCFLMYFVVARLIGRPLATLATTLRSGNADISVRYPRNHRPDEIDALINAIIAGIGARQQVEAERQRHRLHGVSVRRLKMLTQITDSIAHDFGNFLGVIQGFSDLLKSSLPENSKQLRYADRIFVACEGCKDLIGNIHTYLQTDNFERKPVELVPLLRRAENLISEKAQAPARHLFHYSEGAFTVLGNEQLLSELVTGLCVRSSMPAGDWGDEIAVSLEMASRAELENLRPKALSAEERLIGEIDTSRAYLCLRISGPVRGSADDTLRHIFQPFVANRNRHVESGLGASHALRVIESHEGVCHLACRAEGNAICSVYIPLLTTPARKASPAPLTTEKPRKMEHVLLVDEEPGVADMLSLALERLGYETVSVTDPAEALAAYVESPNAWDVVIVGDKEPGIRGQELIERLKSIRPEIRTVLCIGAGKPVLAPPVHTSGFGLVLLKPVDAATIASML